MENDIESHAKYLNFISNVKNKDRKCIDMDGEILIFETENTNEYLLSLIFGEFN